MSIGEPPSPLTTPRITARELLTSAASVARAEAGPFALIAGLCTVPVVLLAQGVGSVIDLRTASIGLWGIGIAAAQGAIAYLTLERLAGRRRGPLDALGMSAARLASVGALALLAFCIISVGCALAVVPGVIVAVVLFAALPVMIAESAGPLRAMRRSVELTRGHRWTLALTMLGAAVPYVVWIFLGACCLAYPLITHAPEEPPYEPSGAFRLLSIGVNLVATWYALCASATLSAVFYVRARLGSRVDAAAVASVFE